MRLFLQMTTIPFEKFFYTNLKQAAENAWLAYTDLLIANCPLPV